MSINFFYLLFEAAKVWIDREGSYLSAAFSYSAPFALIPLIFFSVSVASFLYGEAFATSVFSSWGLIFGDDLLSLIKIALNNLNTETQNYTIPIFGGVFFLGFYVIALNIVGDGLLKMWSKERRGLLAYFKKSFRSILFLVVLQLYLTLVLGFQYFVVPNLGTVGELISAPFWYISTMSFFIIMYRYLTPLSPSWPACFSGAIVSSLFFVMIKGLVNFYIDSTPVLNLYGAAGLILILLVWVYVIAAIVFYGGAVAGQYDKMQSIAISTK